MNAIEMTPLPSLPAEEPAPVVKNTLTPTATETKGKLTKIFNQSCHVLARLPWLESLAALGACLVAMTLGGHILLSLTLSVVVLFLLLGIDNICFICF